MSFYTRKIPYYKSLKLIDSDGDGIKDTIVYQPFSNSYNIQVGLDQDIRDIGHYNLGEDLKFEVFDLSTVWRETDIINPNTEFELNNDFKILKSPNNDIINQKSLTLELKEFCNDPLANNYDSSLLYTEGFKPCLDNSCCTYNQPSQYKVKTSLNADIDCLAIYTDWGPWNDNLLLNDTEQTYITKSECTLTFRLINLLDVELNSNDSLIPGGWYGAGIKIEVDEGNGFHPVTAGSTYIQNINNDISFNDDGLISLNEKVRVWRSQNTINEKTYFYLTKPYRDITIKPKINSRVKVNYYNSPTELYKKYYNKLKLQIIKGNTTETVPTTPTATEVTNSWTWSQNLPAINTFLGSPYNRSSENETFHFVSNSEKDSVNNKLKVWINYLNGYSNPTTTVPWGPGSGTIEVGNFYNKPSVNVLFDFNKSLNLSVIQNTKNPSINYNNNPYEELVEFDFNCKLKQNFISFYDRNGDGFIEYDENYPTGKGSVDDGLFSKTRYDSPYVFLVPGTSDNIEPLVDNPLTRTTALQNDLPISQSSLAGWRNYGYSVTPFLVTQQQLNINYNFRNVSPTCQLGGVDNIQNLNVDLTQTSNNNLFLPQLDILIKDSNKINAASYGTGTAITHLWNYGFTDSNGGCCAKPYNSALDISTSGPYLRASCSTCHGQMTPRSAQPVLDNNIKILMQTTDSDIYYGPFYDPRNPSYNGYGLAFSRANKFCRNVKNKNGVEIINSESGTSESSLFIGGILHGGSQQINPTINVNNNYGVTYIGENGFDSVSNDETNSKCEFGTKLPLKCTRVKGNDPNCPSGNCMKCLFCFKCSKEDKQPGIYVGKEIFSTTGPNNGVQIIKK